MYVPSDDDIWILVESVRGESLIERRRLNLVSIITSHGCRISESHRSPTF